jgi:hypothetical protein
VADRFVIVDRAAKEVQGAQFVLDGTKLLALRTGLLFGQGLGLLFEQCAERALEQSLSGGLGSLFEGEEIGIQRRANVPESAAGNDFAPLGGKITEILEFLGSQCSSGHELSLPWTYVSGRKGIVCNILWQSTPTGKAGPGLSG